MAIKTVLAGIDSFFYGVYIEKSMYEEFLHGYQCLLDSTKECARRNKDNAKIEIGNDHNKRRFYVQPNGRENYRWIIYNGDVSICLSTVSKKDYPCLRVELRSQYLWRLGYKTAIYSSLNWIRSVFGGVQKTVVSRIDLCKDFIGWNPGQEQINCFIGKSRTQNKDYHTVDRMDFYARKCHCLRFGKGNNIVIRIYDKTKEIRDTGNKKIWFHPMWKIHGWKDGFPVWRVEVQYGREALRRRKIYSIEQCLSKLLDLWRIGTRWLELRIPDDHKKVSDWELRPEWKAIQRIPMIFKPDDLQEFSHDFVNRAGRYHLLNTGVGSLTSYIASIEGVYNDSDLIEQFERSVNDYATRTLFEFGFGNEILFLSWQEKLICIAKHKRTAISKMESPIQQPTLNEQLSRTGINDESE